MSSQSEDSVTYIHIMNVDSGFTDDTSTLADLDAREGQFFTQAGVTEHSAITSSASKFYFASKDTAGIIHKSPLFIGNTVKNATYATYDVPVEQISYLGYNNTSGSIDATAGYYSVSIVLNHTFGLLNNSPLIKTLPFKLTTNSQSALAAGIANAGTTAFKREPLKAVKFERINSGAVKNAVATGAITTVVNGSNTVTFSGDGTAEVAVGDILRLGALGATGGGICYIVTAISGSGASAIYTLDQPYQGTSGAVAANVTETVTEGNWGIKMTGVSVTDAAFKPVSDTPFMVNFNVALNDRWTTAAVTYSTGSYIGMGSYQLVAAEEAYTHFQLKGKQVEAYPPTPNHTFEADANSTYNVVEFEASDQEYSSATTGLNPVSKFRIKLYALVTTVDTDLALYVTTVGATTLTPKA